MERGFVNNIEPTMCASICLEQPGFSLNTVTSEPISRQRAKWRLFSIGDSDVAARASELV